MGLSKWGAKRKHKVIGWLIGIGITLAMLAGLRIGVLDFIEQKTIDGRFRIRGEIAADPRIVIVAIDESSFSELGQNRRRKFVFTIWGKPNSRLYWQRISA